jgi:hypothetical protein
MTLRDDFSCNLGRATITGKLKPARHFIFNCVHLSIIVLIPIYEAMLKTQKPPHREGV